MSDYVPGQRPTAPWSDHHWWGLFATAATLPNTAAFTDTGYTNDVQRGDLAWADDAQKLYVCVDPTPGAAIWVAISAGAGGIPSWEWKFSGNLTTGGGANAVTFSDGAPGASLGAGQALVQYPIAHDEVVTIDNFIVNVLGNGAGTDSDFTVIKNGAPTAMTIHVTAGATGVFQEAVPVSFTCTKPDLIGVLLTNTGGGGQDIAGSATFRMSLL